MQVRVAEFLARENGREGVANFLRDTQLPLGGSQYFKIWFDEQKKRPCVEFLPIDRVILPFAASNFYTAERAAEMHEITQWEFNRRIRVGMYRDVEVVRAIVLVGALLFTAANVLADVALAWVDPRVKLA